jgi:hypothetical protein
MSAEHNRMDDMNDASCRVLRGASSAVVRLLRSTVVLQGRRKEFGSGVFDSTDNLYSRQSSLSLHV